MRRVGFPLTGDLVAVQAALGNRKLWGPDPTL